MSVSKPTPYTFDLGNLVGTDPNPVLSAMDESQLRSTARDGAQALINQLLTTCAMTTSSSSSSSSSSAGGVLLTLPSPHTPLPREKAVPAAKAATRWQQFAAKKGIQPKKKEGKMVYDEDTAEWVPRWGFKGANKKRDGEWLVEVDERKERERERGKGVGKGTGKGSGKGRERGDGAGDDRGGMGGKQERLDRVRRLQRKERKEARASRKSAAGKDP